MNKTVIKIFAIFVIAAALIATILLVINFCGFAMVGTDTSEGISAKRLLDCVSDQVVQGEAGLSLQDSSVLPPDHWCMVIDENGDVIWEKDLPGDVPRHYTINDIARMTRWYVADYPVYVKTQPYGLLVLGLPKNSLGKYEIEYSMEWFATLPERVLAVLALNLCLAVLLACIFGIQLYRRLRQLMQGISDLRLEKSVSLPEKGIFREVSQNLNQASRVIARKNAALAQRDSARAVWIAGISHDIRTPLSVVTGYAQALSDEAALSEENRKRAGAILSGSIRIKRLIEDLNLISSMEYDMQPSRKAPVRICPLLRSVVTQLVNNGLCEDCCFDLDLRAERAVVPGDAALLERAVFNLLSNAVTHAHAAAPEPPAKVHTAGGDMSQDMAGCTMAHDTSKINGQQQDTAGHSAQKNDDGICEIKIAAEQVGSRVQIVIADNGRGVDEAVLAGIEKIPRTTHGIGLPMAYRIILVHGGTFEAYNDNGFVVKITLPLQ